MKEKIVNTASNSIWSEIASNPEILVAVIAFTAAIFTAFMTIVGVLITNRSNRKLNKKILKYQAMENDLERKVDLRKSIYLETAESMLVAIQHLSVLNTIDASKENPSNKVTPFLISANKAVLVATDDSGEKINDLLTEFVKVFLNLLAASKPCNDLLIKQTSQQNLYQKYDIERTRILNSMTQFNEEARVEPLVFQALQRSLNFASERAEESRQKLIQIRQSLGEANKDFLRQSMPEMKKLNDYIHPVMVSLRKEIGISTDVNRYKASLEKRLNEIGLATEEFINNL